MAIMPLGWIQYSAQGFSQLTLFESNSQPHLPAIAQQNVDENRDDNHTKPNNVLT
jgi:hypothetical protein